MSTVDLCCRCGKPSHLAKSYTRENGESYHYVCIMINVPMETPLALEPSCDPSRFDTFTRKVLEKHNKYRARHGCGPVIWSNHCSEHAQRWVNHLMRVNTDPSATALTLHHDSYKGMGENLFLQEVKSTLSAEEAGRRIVDNWYSEHTTYDYQTNDYDHECSHFSQLVWKGTWKIGAAYAQVGNIFIAVCNYWPAGNIQGWFLDNVPVARN